MTAHHATQTTYATAAADYYAARATVSDTAQGSGLTGHDLDRLYHELERNTEMHVKLESFNATRQALIDWGLDLIVAAAKAGRGGETVKTLVGLLAKMRL